MAATKLCRGESSLRNCLKNLYWPQTKAYEAVNEAQESYSLAGSWHKNVPLGRSLAIYQTVSLGSSVNKGDGVTLPTSDLDVRQLLPQRKEYGPASIPIRARVA